MGKTCLIVKKYFFLEIHHGRPTRIFLDFIASYVTAVMNPGCGASSVHFGDAETKYIQRQRTLSSAMLDDIQRGELGTRLRRTASQDYRFSLEAHRAALLATALQEKGEETMDKLHELIIGNPFFDQLEATEIDEIVCAVQPQRFESGWDILKQGGINEVLFLISVGEVCLYSYSKNKWIRIVFWFVAVF